MNAVQRVFASALVLFVSCVLALGTWAYATPALGHAYYRAPLWVHVVAVLVLFTGICAVATTLQWYYERRAARARARALRGATTLPRYARH
jgi:TRAP-type C4-dicarboxylate transport system permease small subunit